MKNVFGFLFLGVFLLLSCKEERDKEEGNLGSSQITKDYIRKIPGENDTLPEELVQKGEVLIAYSDCYTCHSLEKRAKGPAFMDIAKRYPIQKAYIDMLAYRIISGGSGAWGNPVMLPHPQISHEEAKMMVGYILSLKEE